MASHSSNLADMAKGIFPEINAEVGMAQDEVRSAVNRLRNIPKSLLQNGASNAQAEAMKALEQANNRMITMLKSLHQQYPHAP